MAIKDKWHVSTEVPLEELKEFYISQSFDNIYAFALKWLKSLLHVKSRGWFGKIF